MRFDFTIPGAVNVKMDGYIQTTLNQSNIQGVVDHPATENLLRIREDATKLTNENKVKFHSVVARLMYLAKRVRPDILFPVTFLSTRVLDPDEDDQKKLLRILRYLNGTKTMGLTLEAGDSLMPTLYIDASFATHADYKSQTGMMLVCGKGCLLARSVKQKVNTKSSAEAEFVALTDSATDALWVRQFVIAQGLEIQPITIYQDNEASISLANKGYPSSQRSRHINIRNFWLTDRITNNEVKIKYVPTSEMLADILTKPMSGEIFEKLRKLLLNL
jgi:hypothetical protein